MPRIIGVDIPGRKQLLYSLQYIYGVGPARSAQIIEKLGMDPKKRADDLAPDELSRLAEVLQSDYTIEGDLRREVNGNIRRLISINCYRGSRHKRGLPVRGQRTSTNARTRKGGKKTVGTVRGKAARAAVKAGK